MKRRETHSFKFSDYSLVEIGVDGKSDATISIIFVSKICLSKWGKGRSFRRIANNCEIPLTVAALRMSRSATWKKMKFVGRRIDKSFSDLMGMHGKEEPKPSPPDVLPINSTDRISRMNLRMRLANIAMRVPFDRKSLPSFYIARIENITERFAGKLYWRTKLL